MPAAAHVCVHSSPAVPGERRGNDALIGSRDRSPRAARVSPITPDHSLSLESSADAACGRRGRMKRLPPPPAQLVIS